MKPNVLVLDVSSLLYRAYYATYQQNKMYPGPNATKLFTNWILTLLNENKYDYVFACKDTKTKLIRKDSSGEYKSNRKPMPEDLVQQLPMVDELLKICNINILAHPGYEADDVAASVVKNIKEQGGTTTLVTSDQDYFQLISPQTKVMLIKNGGFKNRITIDEAKFSELCYGLKPNQFTALLGIAGDASDNIIGVKGISEATAGKIIQPFSSLTELYMNLDKVEQKYHKKLTEQKESALLSEHLATMVDTLPIDIQSCQVYTPFNQPQLQEFVQKHRFSGFDKWFIRDKQL